MIEAIIFDFDGLLADTEGIAFEIYQKLLKKHKLSLTINMYVKDYNGKTDTENMQKIIFIPFFFEIPVFALLFQCY